MKVKLDLHTHIWEASRFVPPDKDIAWQVIEQVKRMGIDGIAVTEHRNKEYGFAFAELVQREFPNEIIVIPGWEIEVRYGPERNEEYQVLELFLPNDTLFRSYCHPGYPSLKTIIDGVQAIEIDNMTHNWHINKEEVQRIAQEHDLLLLKVSDAHLFKDIGSNYTEIEMEELYARARPIPRSDT